MTALATGSVAFAGALLVYVLTLCPTVYVEGSGELIGAVRGLGTPHPTGYPLFCLSGRLLTSLLLFAHPAYEVNLVSALFAAAACGVLAHLLQRRAVRRHALPRPQPRQRLRDHRSPAGARSLCRRQWAL